jgi:hypothetical protein
MIDVYKTLCEIDTVIGVNNKIVLCVCYENHREGKTSKHFVNHKDAFDRFDGGSTTALSIQDIILKVMLLFFY